MLHFPPKVLFCFIKLARFCEMYSLRNVEETFNPDFQFRVAPREIWQPAYHRCQPSCHHTQGAAWRRPSSHPTSSPAPRAAAQGEVTPAAGLPSVVPACGNKKVITMKALGTVKWFNVRNRCGYITRNDTKEDAFTHQTAIKLGHSRRPLCSGRWREFDVEGEKGAEAANATGPGGVPGRKYAAGHSHDRCYPPRRALHAITSRITRIVSGESMRDQRAPES